MSCRRDLSERFWEKVLRNGDDECWPWTAASDPDGYGRFVVEKGDVALAHRVAWTLANGPIPEGEGFHGTCVLHECDNPPCCNPAHLFLGSQFDNVADMRAKGRRPHPNTVKTCCLRGHPFDAGNTYVHRGKRCCKACQRVRCTAYQRGNRQAA